MSASDHERVILKLVNLKTYRGNRAEFKLATKSMNDILLMDGFCIRFKGIVPGIYRLSPEFDLDANEIARSITKDEGLTSHNLFNW